MAEIESKSTTKPTQCEMAAKMTPSINGASNNTPFKFTVKSLLWNLLLLSVGSLLCAIAINGIIVPHNFLSGGIVGVAIVFHYMVYQIPVGNLYLVLNLPIFILGWLYVGRRFFFYSLAGVVIFSVATSLVTFTLPVKDNILAALLAGILSGTGGGIILLSLGSAGGLDILSVIILKRFSIGLGNSVLIFNVILLIIATYIFTLEAALYTLILMFVSSKVLNIAVTGLSQRKAAFIISRRWKEISDKIMATNNLGLTILDACGGYSGSAEKVLYTVFTFRDLPQLKQMVRLIDPEAFVVIYDTMEVMGYRIGNQPHW